MSEERNNQFITSDPNISSKTKKKLHVRFLLTFILLEKKKKKFCFYFHSYFGCVLCDLLHTGTLTTNNETMKPSRNSHFLHNNTVCLKKERKFWDEINQVSDRHFFLKSNLPILIQIFSILIFAEVIKKKKKRLVFSSILTKVFQFHPYLAVLKKLCSFPTKVNVYQCNSIQLFNN